MIPLIYFLILWVIVLGLFFILAGFSVLQMLRFGLAHPVTEISTAVFALIVAVVIVGTIGYLAGVDLKYGLDISALLNVGQTPLF
ncbi:MAG: hypothetical protein WCT54_00540 [Patescibacteria group bacterium]